MTANDELLPPGAVVRVNSEYTYTHEQVMALVEAAKWVSDYVHTYCIITHPRNDNPECRITNMLNDSLTPFTQQKE